MIKRTVEVANRAYLTTKQRQLVIKQGETVAGTVPLEDLGFLILAHPAISLSMRAMSAMVEQQVALIICNERYLPTGYLAPFAGHSLHSKILQTQISASKPVCKRLWQTIVQAKIRAQARLVAQVQGRDSRLFAMAKAVKSGDSGNMEAVAAARYWPLLFGPDFRRDTQAEGLNTLLNYGYSILRAVTARAIAGAGLHPALGLHHRNQYNAYALADDLMEPLRPMVDELVVSWREDDPIELNRATRKPFLELPALPVIYNKRELPLMTAMGYYASTIREALAGERTGCEVPIP